MSPTSPEPRGERELIRRLHAMLPASADVRVPFGDDMAAVPASDLIWTTDMLMDGVDFDSARHDWSQVGRKAMAVNLSDCAAMGVRPLAALCAVALSNRMSMADALALHRGLAGLAGEFEVAVTGGDTNSWDNPTVVCVTVAARCDAQTTPVLRSGARPGDRVYVSGVLGGSILGRHLTFTPRVRLGLEINRQLRPHAMIDISDGLSVDLAHVAEASRCGAIVDERLLLEVVHADAVELSSRDGKSPLDHALHDGEDFELLIVLPSDAAAEDCRRLGLLPLGEIVGTPGVAIRGTDGSVRPVPSAGWEHFR